MKNFINLSSRVINKLHIVEIVKNKNQYNINMSGLNINGFMCTIFGNISSYEKTITICEKNNKQDYDIITNFISNESKN